MTKILFVCHGNICRSPMAEFVMRDLTMRQGCANQVKAGSAALTSEDVGNPIHPGARRVLADHGVACVGHIARLVKRNEYGDWDLFVGMDEENMADLARIFRRDPEGKFHKLMEYAPGAPATRPARDISDPWYTGDFEATYRDVLAGCQGLLDLLRN